MIEKRHEETYRFNYIKLKYVSNINMGQSPDSKDVHLLSEANDQLPFLQGNAEFGKKYPKAKYICENPKKIANKDDILISVRVPVGALNIADKEYGIGRGLCAITPIKIELDYAWWVLNKNVNKLQKISTGSTYEAVSTEDIKNLSIEYPDTKTQQKIADYLDKETARIDGLIEAKERMLKLLEEKRRAIINRAVTRGLNPEAPTKPSGLDWLEEIPEHWKIIKLKYILTIYNGRDYKEVASEEGYPVYGSVGRFAYAKKFLHNGEAVLFGRKGTINKPLYVRGKFWTVDTMFYAVVNVKAITKYIFYMANFFPYEKFMTSTALPSITQDDLNEYKIILPPIDEQKQIIAYIEQFTHKHKILTQELEKSITLLKERRSALSTAAVTGEIDMEGSG